MEKMKDKTAAELRKEHIKRIVAKLAPYTEQGWPVFPLKSDKTPLMAGGFKIATTDLEQVAQWLYDEYEPALWGVRTGKASGLLVIDIDNKNGHEGSKTWAALIDENGGEYEALTRIAYTPSGGEHWYYQMPDEDIGPIADGSLGDGLDIRANRSYAVLPTFGDYGWDDEDIPIRSAPDWLVEKISKRRRGDVSDSKQVVLRDDNEDIAHAALYLNSLDPKRSDNYQQWVEVGMALSELGEIGLYLWDNWSKKSDKYKLGECAEKWLTFEPGHGLTIDSLHYWATEDNEGNLLSLPPAPRVLKPSHYRKAMVAAGWEFRLNEANWQLDVNGIPLARPIIAVMTNQLREAGYKNTSVMQDCYYELGLQNRYHPVRDYLERLEWDGDDHIGKLASYFDDKDGVFDIFLQRWMVGAIARVYEAGTQNRMLVLDGKQNLGKSYFTRWLASEIPDMHIEARIQPDTKDDDVRLMSVWIWEVGELGSTIRRADREALKFFITKEKVTVRIPYDRMDTTRPALSSFIGTINNEAGFLSDPTGHRRFMVCGLTDIDWSYATEVDVGQLWAQAFHLYKNDEPWDLTKEEIEIVNQINQRYETEDPLEDYLLTFYEIDGSQRQWFTPTTDILQCLKGMKLTGNMSDRTAAMTIGGLLKKHGAESTRKRKGSSPIRGYVGVRFRGNSTGEHDDET